LQLPQADFVRIEIELLRIYTLKEIPEVSGRDVNNYSNFTGWRTPEHSRSALHKPVANDFDKATPFCDALNREKSPGG
jgi:hypothetical protein